MLTFDEIIRLAGNSGLESSQVEEFRKKYGANAMTPPVREPLWKQYLQNFDDPIIKILLLAVTISLIVSLVQGSGFLDTIGIIIAILLATGIAFFNEYRSSREFDILNAHRDDMGRAACRESRRSATDTPPRFPPVTSWLAIWFCSKPVMPSRPTGIFQHLTTYTAMNQLSLARANR